MRIIACESERTEGKKSCSFLKNGKTPKTKLKVRTRGNEVTV